jgi:hemoglobin
MAAHLRLPIEPAMFDRWLSLWHETTRSLFDPAIADQFSAKAERIADSLKLALFFTPRAEGRRESAVDIR